MSVSFYRCRITVLAVGDNYRRVCYPDSREEYTNRREIYFGGDTSILRLSFAEKKGIEAVYFQRMSVRRALIFRSCAKGRALARHGEKAGEAINEDSRSGIRRPTHSVCHTGDTVGALETPGVTRGGEASSVTVTVAESVTPPGCRVYVTHPAARTCTIASRNRAINPLDAPTGTAGRIRQNVLYIEMPRYVIDARRKGDYIWTAQANL